MKIQQHARCNEAHIGRSLIYQLISQQEVHSCRYLARCRGRPSGTETRGSAAPCSHSPSASTAASSLIECALFLLWLRDSMGHSVEPVLRESGRPARGIRESAESVTHSG